jgi:hypothetical protein
MLIILKLEDGTSLYKSLNHAAAAYAIITYKVSIQVWLGGWFFPVAPNWPIGHPRNASFHSSFLM